MNAKGSLRPNGVKTCNKPEQHAAIHPKMTVFSCADNLDMFFWPLIIVYSKGKAIPHPAGSAAHPCLLLEEAERSETDEAALNLTPRPDGCAPRPCLLLE